MQCPVCHRVFQPEQSKAMPFCSPRCREIDLGRWLGEEYRVPIEPDDEEDEESGYAPRVDDDDDDE
ncbi:MAG TPA: DNA gyrase inhibitor YacG [Pirellulales bacterium]|nr:DNA gyrase inhibitor YacG [Pirellulales bacterium]